MAENNELMSRDLPKWPQMIVTGTPVSEEQALEIIRRTDDFFDWPNGNNHKFIDTVQALCMIPKAPKRASDMSHEEWANAWKKFRADRDAWLKKWQYIHTIYVENRWVSSLYIGGPCGWIHPDGQIGFAENVGKRPSVKDIYDDWTTIAKAFPFLEIEVTLMDGECCEDDTKPVVSMLIRNGKVKLVDPEKTNVHKEFNREMPKDTCSSLGDYESQIEYMVKKFGPNSECTLDGRTSENAISLDQIQKWVNQVFA